MYRREETGQSCIRLSSRGDLSEAEMVEAMHSVALGVERSYARCEARAKRQCSQAGRTCSSLQTLPMNTDTKSVRRTYRMSCIHKYSLITGGDTKHRFRGASDHADGQHGHQRASNHLPQITTKRNSGFEGLLPPAAVPHQLRWRMAHSVSALASLTSRHLSMSRAAECRCMMAACVLTKASVFAFRYLTSSETIGETDATQVKVPLCAPTKREQNQAAGCCTYGERRAKVG